MTAPAPDAPAYILWFRTGSRDPWRAVAGCPTSQGATDLIGVGGRRNGDWMILPRGKRPDQFRYRR